MAARLLHPMQFIPALSPKFHEPRHLEAFVDLFVRIQRGESLRAVVSCPPGHEKTETLAHCAVWLLKQQPGLRMLYATYGQRLSNKKSHRIRALAAKAGIKLDRHSASKSDWRTTTDEGGMWGSSESGAVIGERFDLLLLDDLVKDRIAAENALARERTYEWTVELAGREEPNASSILIMHAWHPDDVGRRLIRDGWLDVSLPAIGDDGQPLCPQRFTLVQLEKIRERIGDYAWQSLYMQRPAPRGGAVFRDVQTYDALPEGVSLTITIGCDFAYSTKTHADFSVAVVLATDGERYYVLDVVRLRVAAPAFQAELQRLLREHKRAELVAYISGTEKGTVDMMIAQGLPIHARPAIGDKFTRSQPAAAAWNAGKILVPSKRVPWRDAFVGEVLGFTGIRDRRDDQIDALASAFDAARAYGAPPGPDDLPSMFTVPECGSRWGSGRGFG